MGDGGGRRPPKALGAGDAPDRDGRPPRNVLAGRAEGKLDDPAVPVGTEKDEVEAPGLQHREQLLLDLVPMAELVVHLNVVGREVPGSLVQPGARAVLLLINRDHGESEPKGAGKLGRVLQRPDGLRAAVVSGQGAARRSPG